jgi:tRNA/tmRNA/rRNA uracil-C5-methylase (TrmA/RlmC/RlmD family)
VHQLGRSIVKKIMLLAEHVCAFDPQVRSAFIFFDPNRSRYYLDTAQEPGTIKTKTIAGPDKLFVNFSGNKYQYYPTMFSQVNESMVPVMLAKAKELLAPDSNEHLIDLYCGYGLFSHFLASGYAHVCGIEAEAQNIKAAQSNSRFFPATNKVSFFVQRIGKDSFINFLPKSECHAEVLLTDPPRQGMPQPVIAALAQREPIKVLQACCGTDEIPQQIVAWKKAGYHIHSIVPLDMFAGTPHLETLVLFTPGH